MKHFALVLLGLLILSCSKNSVSDRDLKREQALATAETKRAELQLVAGEYSGKLNQDSGKSRSVSLLLDIKDIPTPIEGQVDQVMTPTLVGYLCLDSGGSRCNPNTMYGFAIQKADFVPKRSALDIVAINGGDNLILSLSLTEPKLDGTWTLPNALTSGTISLTRGTTQSSGNIAEDLKGEYQGVMLREGNLFHYGLLTLQTSFQPPDGLKIAAILRVVCGDINSSEYLTYHFDKVQFNAVTGQITFREEGTDIVLSANWSEGEITGDWSSQYTGNLGKIQFKKTGPPNITGAGEAFEALKGTYQGKLTNTNPNSNLPERIQFAFVTAQDTSSPNGLKVSGNVRLYIGPFGSLEYIEQPFTEIQYNYFTKKLVAKTSAGPNLTIKADVDRKTIRGTVAADALGEVATIEVNK